MTGGVPRGAPPVGVWAAWCRLWPHGCCGHRRARPPARLGDLTSFGAAPRSPPVPSGPSGALHTSGAGLLCVPVGGGPPASRPRRELRSARRLEARPGPATAHGRRSQALLPLRHPPHQWGLVAVNSPTRPRHRPRVSHLGPVDQVGRLSTTVVAFACLYLCGIETAVAFAGAKWAFLVHFSGAEVMVVSMVAVQGRAVVLLVSTSPCCCALCAKKFTLRGLMVGVSAKKFALHAQNTPKSAFLRLLGELFRGRAAGGAVLGELFRGRSAGGAVLGEFFRANRPCSQVL